MLLTLSGQANKTKVCMWVHMRIHGYCDYHYGNDLLRSIMIMFVTMPVIVMTMIWLSRLLPLFHLLFQFIITTGMKAIMVNDISSYHLFVLFINARNNGAGLLGLLSMCVVRWSGRMVDPGMGGACPTKYRIDQIRSNSNFAWNSYRCAFEDSQPIITKFGTRHDSRTVVTCTKFRYDRPTIIEIRGTRIFSKFWIRSNLSIRYLVGQAPVLEERHLGPVSI